MSDTGGAMTPEQALKRIEAVAAAHIALHELGKTPRDICSQCWWVDRTVKLARALTELWKGCQYDPEFPYDEGGPSLRVLHQAERVLSEVAGGGDE